MGGQVYEQLRPVRARLMTLSLLRDAALGLLAASIAGVGVGVFRWMTATRISPWLLAAVLIAGPVLGLLIGLARRRTWEKAARAVDLHYDLKDRATTALAFLANPNPSVWHTLQVADAVQHLATVESRAVVPYRITRVIPAAFGTLALAVALLFVPIASKKAQAGLAPPRPEMLAVHDKLVEDLKQLDKMVEGERDEKLDALLKQLKQKVDELAKPGVDEKEALAKLSEMQAAIAAQQAQYNTGLVDGQLQSLGEAIAAADSLEAAGAALQEGKFDQAAKELEKLENPELDPKEAKAVEEKLKQVAKAMGDAGLGLMGEAATELAEGIKSGNKGRISKGAKGLAGIARTHARRRRIARILEAELEDLDEAKKMSKKNGGPKSLVKKKSTTPSTNWGRGIAGNTEGEKTNLLGKRDIKEVTGDPGDDGDSEMETTHSPEGRQRAARGYKEAYRKALKQSEAVLDSEPIPLGHRQTIRRYFELIRPQNEEPAGKASEKDGK
jgi:hypothetical protein